MSGRFPNIRYEDSYDSFKYDDVLKTEVLDYMKIRGSSGIINQNIADIVIDGGLLSKQGIMVGQAKVGGQVVDAKTTYSTEYSGTLSFNKKNNELVIIKKDGIAFDMLDANVNFYFANVEKTLTAGSAIVDTSFETDTLLANTGNINGDLQIKTITMNQFSVDINGNVISNSINNSNGGIVNTGPILGATDIKASGNLVMGGNMLANGDLLVEGNFRVNGNTTIINTENKVTKDHLVLMNYGNSTELTTNSGIIIANVENPPYNNLFFGTDKDGVFTSFLTDSLANSPNVNFGSSTTARFGNIILTETSSANAINTEGDIHVGDIFGSNIDGTGDLTMNTITMTGFSVDTSGNIVTASIDNSNGGIINVGDLIGINDFSLSGNLITQGIDNNNTFINNAGIISNITHVEGNVNIKGGTLSYPVTSQYYPVPIDVSMEFTSMDTPDANLRNEFNLSSSSEAGLFLNNKTGKLVQGYNNSTTFVKNGPTLALVFELRLLDEFPKLSSRNEEAFTSYLYNPIWINKNFNFEYADVNGNFQSFNGLYEPTTSQMTFAWNSEFNNQKTQWACGSVGSINRFRKGQSSDFEERLNKGLGRILKRTGNGEPTTYWLLYFKDGQDGKLGYAFNPNNGKERAPSEGSYLFNNAFSNGSESLGSKGFSFSNNYNILYKVLPISIPTITSGSDQNFGKLGNKNDGYSFTLDEMNYTQSQLDGNGIAIGNYTSRLYWTKGFYLDDSDGAFIQITNPRSDGIPIGTYNGYNYSWETGGWNVISGGTINWMIWADSTTIQGGAPAPDSGPNQGISPTTGPGSTAVNGIYPIINKTFTDQPKWQAVNSMPLPHTISIYSPKVKICAKDATAKTNIFNNTDELFISKIEDNSDNRNKLATSLLFFVMPKTIKDTTSTFPSTTNYVSKATQVSNGTIRYQPIASDYSRGLYFTLTLRNISPALDINTNPDDGYINEKTTDIEGQTNEIIWTLQYRFASTPTFPSPQGKLVTPQLYINSSTDPVGTKGEVVLDQLSKLNFYNTVWNKILSELDVIENKFGDDGDYFLKSETSSGLGRFYLQWSGSSINNPGNFNVNLYMSRNDGSAPHYVGFFENTTNPKNNATSINFTGQHRCIPKNKIDISKYGLIVIATGKYLDFSENIIKPTINESLPICDLCDKDNDKRVFGVISNEKDDEEERSIGEGCLKTIYRKVNLNEKRLHINSVGEGAIWVCNKNGDLENGTYITSSSVVGYGMKQDSEFLKNTTVAKITCDCTFNIKHIIKQKVKTIINEDGKQELVLDEKGNIQYEDDLDDEGNQQLEYEYDTRFLNEDGTIINSEEEYNTKLNNKENVFIAQFVGCTYHCG